MLPRIDLRGRLEDARDLLPRAAVDVAFAVDAVRPTLDAIRVDGDVAVRIATAQFDEIELDDLRVPADEIEAAIRDLDTIQPGLRAALEECIRRARLVHEAQRRPDETVTVAPGGTVTERWLPVNRVGLYVPGGLIAYPSSVVMNVVPAQVAGVSSIAIASPPQKEHGGRPHPAVLGAAGL
ncbi:MAG: histidinol dehydrogenase, partial [Frankiaceae bacterium]|nr:histidinol dehydrogenase [Frankiaceae bacterium]